MWASGPLRCVLVAPDAPPETYFVQLFDGPKPILTQRCDNLVCAAYLGEALAATFVRPQ